MTVVPYNLTNVVIQSEEFLEESAIGFANGLAITDYGKYVRTAFDQEIPAPTATEFGKPMVIYNTGSSSIEISGATGVNVNGLTNIAPSSGMFVYPVSATIVELTGGI